jgi:hypothetical protein
VNFSNIASVLRKETRRPRPSGKNDVFLPLKSFVIFLPLKRLPPCFLPPLKTEEEEEEEEEARGKLETVLALTLILMTRALSLFSLCNIRVTRKSERDFIQKWRRL